MHSALQVNHGTADPFALLIPVTVADTKHGLRIACHHADGGGHPHPKECSRPPCGECGRHSHDISGTDGSRQCRTGRLKLCHGTFLFQFLFPYASDGHLPPVRQPSDLEKTGLHRINNADPQKQDQQPWPPDKLMNSMYHRCRSNLLLLRLIRRDNVLCMVQAVGYIGQQYLTICPVKNILTAAHHPAEFLEFPPGVMVVKLVAVPPDIVYLRRIRL